MTTLATRDGYVPGTGRGSCKLSEVKVDRHVQALCIVQLQGHHTLHKAAWAGHKDVCEWLQDLGVDPECKEVDKKGHTASRLAEIAGHVELSQWLVRRRKNELPLKK